jgi:outer membrane protein OmpA-like peptidoglycan-associated protein
MFTRILSVTGAIALVAGMAIAVVASPALAEDCAAKIDSFNAAVDAGMDDLAQGYVDEIATSPDCSRYELPVQRRLAAQRLQIAQLMMARGRPVAEYESLLLAAQKPQVLWQASATLGEVRFGQRRFADAAQAYDVAVEIIKNETLTPVAPSKYDIEGLIDRAGEARLLAASDPGASVNEKFVAASKDQRNGLIGGFYSQSVRGIVPRSVPVPITFEYRTTAFTDAGQEAVRELLEVVQEQKPSHMVLVGHADSRGTAEFNMKLSRERADAVADFLRQNGVQVPIRSEGKGATEPIQLPDTSGLTEEDIYALNRRVEWLRD